MYIIATNESFINLEILAARRSKSKWQWREVCMNIKTFEASMMIVLSLHSRSQNVEKTYVAFLHQNWFEKVSDLVAIVSWSTWPENSRPNYSWIRSFSPEIDGIGWSIQKAEGSYPVFDRRPVKLSTMHWKMVWMSCLWSFVDDRLRVSSILPERQSLRGSYWNDIDSCFFSSILLLLVRMVCAPLELFTLSTGTRQWLSKEKPVSDADLISGDTSSMYTSRVVHSCERRSSCSPHVDSGLQPMPQMGFFYCLLEDGSNNGSVMIGEN